MSKMTAMEQVQVLDAYKPNEYFGALPPALQSLVPASLEVVQINLGKKCNQACLHCHVDASPARTESMSMEVAEQCLRIIRETPSVQAVDLTGGAPELHEAFRFLAQESRAAGKRVIDRCNLTVLFEPGQQDLAEFLYKNKIEVVASLPALDSKEADSQRGNGVFYKSIEALQLLNDMGYGTHLPLHLVYNPVTLALAGSQVTLEKEYKELLSSRYGIHFTGLYAVNNIPVSRFLESLLRSGDYNGYMDMLAQAYNPATVPGLMCRTQMSVGYDGFIYDCDFNQMLELKVPSTPTVFDFNRHAFETRQIITKPHCLGCTAGAGSSCGGSLV
jgi:radical SAM/Cys-rich protein